MTDYGAVNCWICVVLTLFSLFLSLLLQVMSCQHRATPFTVYYTSHHMFKAFQIFLSALCTTTGSILYQHIWPWSSAWPLLICLLASVAVFRRIDVGNTKCRFFTLMVIAFFCGLTLVRLLDSSHPIPHCAIVCVLWLVAVPSTLIQLFAFMLTAEFCYYIVFVMHLSGCTALIVSYLLATVFGISGSALHYQLLLGIHICTEFIYSILRRYFIPRFDDEDKDELLLRTFYSFISFIDVVAIVLLFLRDCPLLHP